jgi:hypothetical protein
MHNLKNDLVGKIYGDYNALAINMGIGCDCDSATKALILEDYLGTSKPDVNENEYETEAKKIRILSEISKSENKIIYVPIRKPKNSDNTL